MIEAGAERRRREGERDICSEVGKCGNRVELVFPFLSVSFLGFG